MAASGSQAQVGRLLRQTFGNKSKIAAVLTRAYSAQSSAPQPPLRTLPLDALHKSLGAQMVPFCGWSMPLGYKGHSLVASHLHTREAASLFDVSHMMQVRLHGRDRVKFIESLVVGNIAELQPGEGTLSLITNENGGIKDDTVINNVGDYLYLVCNAGCADKDLAHFQSQLKRFNAEGGETEMEVLNDHALLALQGPASSAVLSPLTDTSLSELYFMQGVTATVAGVEGCRVTRCGYTGEDGFEISIPHHGVAEVANALLSHASVKPAGLGPRDTLRLEAGLCLYGHDIEEDTTPVEAVLYWTVGRRRRKEGGFPGSARIREVKKTGPAKVRVGLIVEGPPAREKSEIFDEQGTPIGVITSGSPSPSLKRNIAMAYVDPKFKKAGSTVCVKVRNHTNPATVVTLPFVSHRYHRQA